MSKLHGLNSTYNVHFFTTYLILETHEQEK